MPPFYPKGRAVRKKIVGISRGFLGRGDLFTAARV